MTYSAVSRAVLACTLLFSNAAWSQDQKDAQEDPATAEIRKLPWQVGPAKGTVGSKATIDVPADAGILDEAAGERFLKLTGNLPSPGNTVMANGDWWATFSFSDVGFVKDDEKLDPDALLASIKETDEPGNEQRRKLGFQQLHTDGWVVPPHYDAESKHLEWGIRLRVEGSDEPVVNYTVRLLGRTGYESVVLVTSPATLSKDVAELRTVLKTFDFNAGEKYSEFRPGDHVAEIGLGALVVGGAAAAVVKTGFWKVILAFLAASWKLVVAAVVALFAGIGKLVKRKA
ncbi:hypothetical protein BH10PSE17_BH10PSE17_13810 [soil metagenome]